MDRPTLDLLKQVAKGVAAQFGSNCEVVVHSFDNKDAKNTIEAIENGHVTNRTPGDDPYKAVLKAVQKDSENLQDHLGYITATTDGRVLKSSSIFIRDSSNKITGMLAINYDITNMLMAKNAISKMVDVPDSGKSNKIVKNVNDLLYELIEQSVRLVGKPIALMSKDDKIRSIQFLSDNGAFLITKSSEKVCKVFNISKYTLYNYIDSKSQNLPNTTN